MASPLWKLCSKTLNGNINAISGSIRWGHHLRGKPPGIAKTLEQKMQGFLFKYFYNSSEHTLVFISEWAYQDPSLHFKVDIGLPPPQISKSLERKERMKILKPLRSDPNLEKLSRNKQCELNNFV